MRSPCAFFCSLVGPKVVVAFAVRLDPRTGEQTGHIGATSLGRNPKRARPGRHRGRARSIVGLNLVVDPFFAWPVTAKGLAGLPPGRGRKNKGRTLKGEKHMPRRKKKMEYRVLVHWQGKKPLCAGTTGQVPASAPFSFLWWSCDKDGARQRLKPLPKRLNRKSNMSGL